MDLHPRLADARIAIVGLGYVGRETSAAAAWHIPVGVAIFGLACYQLAAHDRR